MENKSEVAHILAKIDAEFQAGHLALHGFAEGTARHTFITRRMENMYNNLATLRAKYGEDVAMQALIAWQDGTASQESGRTAP